MTPSYALGLFFIFLVSVIWSAASIVVQYLYHERNFDSPFLLTYIGTSLFIVLLPVRLVWERRRRIQRYFCKGCAGQESPEEGLEIIPWRTSDENASYQEVPSVPPEVVPTQESQESNSTISTADCDEISGNFQLVHHATAADKTLSKETEPVVKEHQHVATDGGHAEDYQDSPSPSQQPRLLSHQQHFKMAMKIAPIWFFANWAYNTSLAYTSILSSTVLASTGSLFTFLFAVSSGDEAFTVLKLTGVLLGIMGSVMTAWHDMNVSPVSDVMNTTATTADSPHNDDSPWGGHQIWGDIIGLLSAVGYGTYTVMIRVLCPRDERCMSMQLLLGYIGLLNGAILLPITVELVLRSYAAPANNDDGNNDTSDSSSTAVATHQLTWVVFGYLVAKGMLDNVLSDYLWARAVVLTSATVATVGLGLTIPLAFISDWILGHGDVVSVQSITGALAVLSGFILVNIDGALDAGETTSEVLE